MRKIIMILCVICLLGCTHSHDGQLIVHIESDAVYGKVTECKYYTNTSGLWSFPVSGPCNLYKVGDTLKLTK